VKVEVVRSPRRRKTVQARETDGVLRVLIPATMTAADEARWVAEMLRRVEQRSTGHTIDLEHRAAQLARRYRLERPTTIVWSGQQEWRWGSCTPATGSVRISSRLTQEPGWVLDYVIIHELAHLSVPGHDRAFWAVVNRYPLAERARGFLIARGREPDENESSDDVCDNTSAAEPSRAAESQGAESQAAVPASAAAKRTAGAPKARSRSAAARQAKR
jgi:predicted metal-dependent hydrolase